jgi:hypothetical protein
MQEKLYNIKNAYLNIKECKAGRIFLFFFEPDKILLGSA